MNTALYLHRIIQSGFHLADLDRLEYGMVMDVITEAQNDACEYRAVASQGDFDRF